MKMFYKLMPAALVAALLPTIAFGATVTLLSDSMDSATGWAVNNGGDSSLVFGYDYSADGIPEAPNSGTVGGVSTSGVKATANNSASAADGIAAVRNLASLGHAAGSSYTIQMDIWGNWGGSNGTTEFLGLSVGRGAASSDPDGASAIYTNDGGSSRDYRLYKNFDEQRTSNVDAVEGPQYGAIDNATQNGNNGGLAPFDTQFPSLDIATATGGLQAGNTGTTDAGDGGFTWVTIEAVVRPLEAGPAGVTADLGTATFYITNTANGVKTEIGVLDNSNGDPTVVSSFEGHVGLLYADLLDPSSNSGFTFGIFDNVIITEIPEPTSVVLLGIGALGLLSGRRRQSAWSPFFLTLDY